MQSEADNEEKVLEERIKMLRESGRVAIENKKDALGLIDILAYHCWRCNYVWLPKDLDVAINRDNSRIANSRYTMSWEAYMLIRNPPKSCARCKSRSWRLIPDEDYNDNYFEHSWARIRAQERVEKVSPDYDPQEEKYLKRLAREYNGDEYERRATSYIIKRSLKKEKQQQ